MILYSISPLTVGHGGRCNYDYVQLFAGLDRTDDNSLGKLCGSHPPQLFYAVSAITMVFRTDSSIVDRGWRVHFNMSCKSAILVYQSIFMLD